MTNWTPMPYERLLAFQAAKELLGIVREAKIADAHLRDQALRAAKSACLNVAEVASGQAWESWAQVVTVTR